MRRLAARQCAGNMSDHGSMSEPDPSVSRNGDDTQSIDIELLIAEVKKRPLLYKKAQTEYLEKIKRKKEWTGVCQGIYHQWNKFSPKKKIDKVKEVQIKWMKLKESFLKSYGGVQKLSPLAKKKRQGHFERMSFLIPSTMADNVDMAHNNNNEPAFELGIETPTEITQEDAIPSTSAAQNVAQFAQTYEVKKQPFIIPMPIIEEPKYDPIDENMHFALMLVPLLRRLNTEQRYYAWPNIIEVLQKAGEMGSKINVLQNELRYPDAVGTNNLLQGLNFPVTEPEPEPIEEEPIFPPSHGRPTNEQGEILYPETDTEDLDEV